MNCLKNSKQGLTPQIRLMTPQIRLTPQIRPTDPAVPPRHFWPGILGIARKIH